MQKHIKMHLKKFNFISKLNFNIFITKILNKKYLRELTGASVSDSQSFFYNSYQEETNIIRNHELVNFCYEVNILLIRF